MVAIALILSLQSYLSLLFFAYTAVFILFSLLLSLLRVRPHCNCHVCNAYLNSTWKSQFDNLVDWYTYLLRSSPTGTIHIHVLNNTITTNQANIEYMLTTHFDNFPKGKPFSAILGDLLGHGIFNVDGDHWRFQRKMASLELGSVSIRSHAFDVISTELHHRLLPLLGAANGSTTVDLQDVFRRFSFDTICKISFGLDPGCLHHSLPMSEFTAAFDTASRLSAWRGAEATPLVWKLKRFFNLGSERELRRAIGLVDKLANEVIRQRRNQEIGDNDLLSRFMMSVDDDKYLRDIVVSFLLAGRDTVASSLTSFFFLLSKHPAVEAAIVDEIKRTSRSRSSTAIVDEIKRTSRSSTAIFDEIRGMHYVHAALYESMRLYPPVQFDSKFCIEDDVLPDGTFVSAGTRVTYHPYAMGRMESVWGSDCAEFKPERWLRPDGEFRPENAFKYPVFQGGLRACLGKELAIMEMKTVVVAIVKQFKIVLVGHERRSLKFVPGLTATVEGGLPALVLPREVGAG